MDSGEAFSLFILILILTFYSFNIKRHHSNLTISSQTVDAGSMTESYHNVFNYLILIAARRAYGSNVLLKS